MASPPAGRWHRALPEFRIENGLRPIHRPEDAARTPEYSTPFSVYLTHFPEFAASQYFAMSLDMKFRFIMPSGGNSCLNKTQPPRPRHVLEASGEKSTSQAVSRAIRMEYSGPKREAMVSAIRRTRISQSCCLASVWRASRCSSVFAGEQRDSAIAADH